MALPSLDLLRTFLAVYRSGSITAAARRLGLSQPAVTAQVKQLEATLGRPLFRRHTRGVTATAAAAELARRLARPLDALTAALGTDPHAAGDPANRVVHLGGPAELTTARVVSALAGFPGGLRITFGLTDDLIARLASAELDIVIATSRPRRRGLSAQPLCDEEFVLVGPPHSRVATAGARELAQLPLVAYSEDMPIIRRYWRHVFGTPHTGRAAVVVPDLRAVLAAVVAGAGISVLPTYLCATELESGMIVPLYDPPDPPINTLYLATRAGALNDPHLAALQRTLLASARNW